MIKNISDKLIRDPMTPSLLRVILAYAIDWYIVAFLSALPVYLMRSLHLGTLSIINQTNDLPDVYMITAIICAVILTLAYFIVLPLRPAGKRQAGQTPGRRLLKIKLVHIDGTDITLKDALYRNIFILIFEGSLFPSILYIREALGKMTSMDVNYVFSIYMAVSLVLISFCLFNKQRRAGHDLFSKTKIVKCAPAE